MNNQVITSIKDSTLEVSPTKGVKAEGMMSWVVLIMLFVLGMFYINLKYGTHIKSHIKKRGGQIRNLFKGKKK